MVKEALSLLHNKVNADVLRNLHSDVMLLQSTVVTPRYIYNMQIYCFIPSILYLDIPISQTQRYAHTYKYSQRLFSLRLILRRPLPPLYHSLRPNASKHQPYPNPLHPTQAMAKPKHTQHHRQHFPRHRHRHEQQARKATERVIDEYLPKSATGRESKYIR